MVFVEKGIFPKVLRSSVSVNLVLTRTLTLSAPTVPFLTVFSINVLPRLILSSIYTQTRRESWSPHFHLILLFSLSLCLPSLPPSFPSFLALFLFVTSSPRAFFPVRESREGSNWIHDFVGASSVLHSNILTLLLVKEQVLPKIPDKRCFLSHSVFTRHLSTVISSHTTAMFLSYVISAAVPTDCVTVHTLCT